MTTQKRWEEEFEEKCMKDWDVPTIEQKQIKSFIKKVEDTAREEERGKAMEAYDDGIADGMNLAKETLKLHLLEEVEGMIDEERKAEPADDLERMAEWYKVSALDEVIKKINRYNL